MTPTGRPQKVAVLIPCYNEALTIEAVVGDVREVLPMADIYVYDNNSTDGTAAVARKAGAIVRRELRQGKGAVVRRMFSDVDADLYLLIDGDATYDASKAGLLVEEALSGPFDLVNVARLPVDVAVYRLGHAFGNRLLTFLVQRIFGTVTHDMLSGYKIMSRRFVKSFPLASEGFEIETEIAIHALSLQIPCSEISASYRERPTGSSSKLRTIQDGVRILRLIGFLFKEEKPLMFFSIVSALLLITGLLFGIPVVVEFFETNLVPRLPTAILSSALVLTSLMAFVCGLILDVVARGRREAKILSYLAIPAVTSDR